MIVPAMLAALRRPAGGGGVGSSACPDAPATPAAFTSFVTQLSLWSLTGQAMRLVSNGTALLSCSTIQPKYVIKNG